MSLILERISNESYQTKKTGNTLDDNTIYFVYDKGVLYTHNELYSGKYELVDELPDVPELNTVYILNDTLEAKMYDGTEYRVVAKGYSSIIDENSDDSTVPTSKAVYTKFNEVFQNVSDGKELIASAITDLGVETSSDATFGEMASNIRKIDGESTLTSKVVKDVCISNQLNLVTSCTHEEYIEYINTEE